MRRIALLVATTGLAALLSVASYAATATKTVHAQVPLAATDWAKTLSVQKFDLAPEKLLSVKITFGSSLEGFVKYENLNAEARDISLSVTGSVGLNWDGGTQVLTPHNYTWSTVVNCPKYDGTFDWAGNPGDDQALASGGIATVISAQPAPTTVTFTKADDPSVINYFIGNTGQMINFQAFSNVTSNASASGRVAMWYQTDASTQMDVEYTYDSPTVPEPASLLAIATGLIGMVGTVLKRRV